MPAATTGRGWGLTVVWNDANWIGGNKTAFIAVTEWFSFSGFMMNHDASLNFIPSFLRDSKTFANEHDGRDRILTVWALNQTNYQWWFNDYSFLLCPKQKHIIDFTIMHTPSLPLFSIEICYICTYIYIYIFMYTYVCLYVHIYIYVHTYTPRPRPSICTHQKKIHLTPQLCMFTSFDGDGGSRYSHHRSALWQITMASSGAWPRHF